MNASDVVLVACAVLTLVNLGLTAVSVKLFTEFAKERFKSSK